MQSEMHSDSCELRRYSKENQNISEISKIETRSMFNQTNSVTFGNVNRKITVQEISSSEVSQTKKSYCYNLILLLIVDQGYCITMTVMQAISNQNIISNCKTTIHL